MSDIDNIMCYIDWFVVSNIFSRIYGIILPIDELICFKMVKSSNQIDVVATSNTVRSTSGDTWK